MEERFTGRGRPSPKQLDNHVVQEVAVKWKDLGVQLLKNNSTLDIIEANHRQDVVRCCQELFKKWLETENASWDQLLEALRSPSIQFVYLANQIEQMLVGDDSTVSMTTSKEEAVNKLITSEDLEVEFALTTNNIKQVLCNSPIDVMSVIEQLQTISAVKDKNVPLLDEDVIENVTTVEKLWQKLNRFWSIFDYDVLRILLKLIKCKKADEIFEEFLSRVDLSVIKDIDLVAHYEIFERKGLMKPLLRIKVKVDKFTDSIKREVEEAVSLKFRLEKYSLRFKGIKEGCIELVYEVSNAMMSYFLHYKFDGYDLTDLAACKIISLYINDMELQIPSEIDMDRIYEWSAVVQIDESGFVKEAVQDGGGTRIIGIAVKVKDEKESLRTTASQTQGTTRSGIPLVVAAKLAAEGGVSWASGTFGTKSILTVKKGKHEQITKEKYHDITEQTTTKRVTRVGRIGGSVVGAAAGAVLGSVVPGTGTAIGGVVGGTLGWLGGSLEWAEWFGGTPATKGVIKETKYPKR